MTPAPQLEDTATRVFAALADPTRRTVLESVSGRGFATATAVAGGLTISRQAVLKHLTVLADAGLVESSRTGREVRFRVRPEPLRHTASWLADRADSWDDRLFALKAEAEKRSGRG
ncbi:ArsR family transcriptional regulator [Janibacter sp. HTCC2649]|uniref:ArsR/SmtB family transcription factor n=1 Tax=Janibacter sp. HTCC2649 TaxID=313589 RepID=UPI000066F61B|nr:metalloregulator ArsR/SmtB family transcription factor [Janibacter sp. HTCC2649]EAP96983.1 ArsR family transcriptional regulator [Janibacter sp. HTCC2649]